MSRWDTPPDGDFARYVEELSRQSPQHVAHTEMTGVVPSRAAAAAAAPVPAPNSIGAKNAAAVAAAQRAAAARKEAGPAAPAMVSNADAAPVVVQPAALWQAVRLPVFAYIVLQVISVFVPEVRPYTSMALFFFIAWAIYRLVKLVRGSDAWQKAARHVAEELKKQQREKRG